MSPREVAARAKKAGLDLIAITDHNSMANCQVYGEEALRWGLDFLYGVEIQSAEEIHIIALFDDTDRALAFDKLLYQSLLPIDNDPEFFGDQVVIDEKEMIIRFEDLALINSSTWTFEEVFDQVTEHGGFAFPAHVDAHTFSVIGQLGFIPPHPQCKGVEITARANSDELQERYDFLQNYTLLRNSDAHYLTEIGKAFTNFFIKAPTVEEISKAVSKKGKRQTRVIS